MTTHFFTAVDRIKKSTLSLRSIFDFNLYNAQDFSFTARNQASEARSVLNVRKYRTNADDNAVGEKDKHYSMISVTTPDPTVLPPSLIANLSPSSIAIGVIRLIVIVMLSPGMHISVPSGSCRSPVTSVVLK